MLNIGLKYEVLRFYLNMQIKQLFIYPIKSLGGVALTQSEVTTRGLKYDRRYMLIDEHHVMLTQRETKELAAFKVTLAKNGFIITFHEKQIEIPFELSNSNVLKTKVWDDEVDVVVAPKKFNEWFGNCLNKQVMLVYMPNETLRAVNPKYALNNEVLSLADGYPVLMISEASLDLLNSKLKKPILMDRFRPNIVVDGLLPHQEDELGSFELGSVKFKVAKPCARCLVVTINQQTLASGKEPLATLAKYRRVDDKVNFGANLICLQEGVVKIS